MTLPHSGIVAQGSGQAIAYISARQATLTTTFITGSPAYPMTATLGVVQSDGSTTVTTLQGTLTGGSYHYTFNDGPLGVAALVFAVPANARKGIVLVTASAVAACGTARSTTAFYVTGGSGQASVSVQQDVHTAREIVSGMLPSGSLPGAGTAVARVEMATHDG